MADDSNNLEVQEAINKAILARNALLDKQTAIMKGQVQIAVELNNALKGEKLKGMEGRLEEIVKGIQSAKDAADKAEESLMSMTNHLNDFIKAEQEAAKAAAEAAEAAEKFTKAVDKKFDELVKKTEQALDDMGDSFSNTFAMIEGLVGVVGSLTRGIFSIGTAVLSIPFKIFNYLTDKASELMNAGQELREAFENVRDVFGDYSRNEGRAVVDSFNTLRQSGGSLAGTGLSMAKVFGIGPAGLAKALTELTETASAMGAVFSVLQDSFSANADKIYIMSKGMGMSNEDLKALGSTAIATGQDMTQMLSEMGNLAVQMGNKFGISSKLIGKDLAYMTTNMGKFGSMTKTQMVTSVVYLRKLGMELKDIEGLMGAFDDFETAATNAAKLAQGFGMTVDAFKMMKEQDPAKRLDMLRQAFAATGRSIESMSRQERAMLASSAGLDENMVSLALSSKNMGKSYEQIQREAEKSNKKQLSQAEVMDKLSDNIKRMTEAMSQSGGFFERFFKGFEYGFLKSKPMMKLLHNLGQSLWNTEKSGRTVGDMFARLFPGIEKMANALAKFFDPRSFGRNLRAIEGLFSNFFKDLSVDPVKATEKFIDGLKKLFTKFFGQEAGGALKDGFQKFAKAASGIAGFITKKLIELMTEGMKGLTGWLKDPKNFLKGQTGGMSSILAPFLTQVSESLPAFKDALVGLLGVFARKYGPKIMLVFAGLFAFAIGKAILAAVVGAAIRSGTEALGQALTASIKRRIGASLIRSGAFTPLQGAIQGGITNAATPTPGMFSRIGSRITGGFSRMSTSVGSRLGPISARMTAPLASVGTRGVGLIASGFARTASLLATMMAPITALFAKFVGAVTFLFSNPVGWVVLGALVIGAIGAAIGTALKKMGKEGFFNKMGLEPGTFSGWIGDFFFDSITMSADLVMEGWEQFYGGIKKFVSAIFTGSGDDLADAAIEMVMGLGELLLGLLGSLGNMLLAAGGMLFKGLFTLMQGLYVDLPKKIIAGIIKFIPGLGEDAAKKFTGFIDSITAWLPWNWGKKVEKASDSMAEASKEAGEKAAEGISDGMSAGLEGVEVSAEEKLGNVSALVGDYGKKTTKDIQASAEEINRGLDNLKLLVSQIDQTKITEIESAMKGVNTAGLDAAGEYIEKVSDSITRVTDSMTAVINSINATVKAGAGFNATAAVAQVQATAASLSSAITAMSSVTDVMKDSLLSADMTSKLDSVSGEAFTGATTKYLDFINDMTDLMDTSATNMPKIKKSADILANHTGMQYGQVVRAIVEDIKAVNDALADLGDVNINSTIDKIGDGLQLKKEVLNIERKPIQMTVNLNLAMKAEDIAKEIFKVAAKLSEKESEPDNKAIRQAFGLPV